MEYKIVEKLLKSYNLNPDSKTIEAVKNLIKLGFNNYWLRNSLIICQFDEMYKEQIPTMEIYAELSLDHKDLSVNHIRKIISERADYEI